ncbi:MAG: hypothetical protein IMF05_01710 [Proteobacteria bacterium]|nr:hypothetical protein [Pseudomonadota bacterium]
MTEFLPDPAALALYATASLALVLAGNPGWRLATSALFGLAARMVLFDRRNFTKAR